MSDSNIITGTGVPSPCGACQTTDGVATSIIRLPKETPKLPPFPSPVPS